MKRRVLCFIISLALCLNLCPVWAADEGRNRVFELSSDYSQDDPFLVPGPNDTSTFITNGYTFTGNGEAAIRVVSGGELYLSGTVKAPNGYGVEVQTGGAMTVTDDATYVTGDQYALYIASGAEVKLSGGTYFAKGKAIYAADGDFAGLLGEDCAFFDASGNPVLLKNAATAKQLTVGQCPGHSGKVYSFVPGSAEHTWSCPYCGAEGSEACSFDFDVGGNGVCGDCGNEITVTVDRDSLKVLARHPDDETIQPASGSVTVKVKDAEEALTAGSDYKVKYKTRADEGSPDVTVTVTVTGITFGGSFTESYTFAKDELTLPPLQWAATEATVTYTGEPVKADSLPAVTINIEQSSGLEQFLQYSYRKQGETAYSSGLPTNAGVYDVVVSLPEMEGVFAVSSEPITLTVEKLDPISKAPAAKSLTYNWDPQELVTAGELKPAAEKDGAVILYATSKDGDYSTEIPTGITVSSSGYHVWYKVEATDNCNGVGPLEVSNVKILHRQITPRVDLSQYTYLYDGGVKQPTVTVTDTELGKVIPDSEYKVEYFDNQNVSTTEKPAKVVVSNKANGNYTIKDPVTVPFEITLRTQDALSITGQRSGVIYGDVFTLGTQGGSGNGDVSWEITTGKDTVATVDPASGQVTVTGDGTATVKATKSGTDDGVTNYNPATATWTFTAGKRPVTATVTAEDKFYGEIYNEGDELNVAKVHAVVESGVLPGDEIRITGLTGAFSDENAGVGKTVTVNTAGAQIEGHNSQHYAVTYSSTSVKATINKAVVHITKEKDAENLTYSGEEQALLDNSVLKADTEGVSVEYSLSKDGTYSTEIPKGTNAGTYTVWYRVKETDNYTGVAPDKVDVTIEKKPVAPKVVLDTASYVYDGSAKEPGVTVYEANGITLIPADQYTVSYSNNVNVGTATVTVTAKADGNYEFTPVPTTFEIKEEKARVITAPKPAGLPLYYSTFAQELVTAGTAYGGTMVYWVDDGVTAVADAAFSDQIPTKADAREYTVHYKVEGDGNHSDSDVGHVTVTIAPKTVNSPTIELYDGEAALVSYTYDGNAKEPTVVVKDGSTVIGGDEYNVIYSSNTDAGNGLVSITDKLGGNYTVTGSATFVIKKADIKFEPAPSAADITYDGKPHELLNEGTFEGGTVLYALDSKTSEYSAAIPKATEAGDYTVYYKVVGDNNHNNFTGDPVPVTIKRKPLETITIELSPKGFEYDGTVKMPTVTVKDGNTVLSEEEYGWSCNVDEPTDVGTYTITINEKAGGNYDLTKAVESNKNTAAFTIGQIAQEPLVIDHSSATTTNYGDTFTLSVSGGSGTGAVSWIAASGPVSVGPVGADGKATVTITGVGEVTITVKKDADTNYLAASAQWTFTAAPKPVTATVTVSNKLFDGNTSATVASAGIATINGDTVTIDPNSITAAFDTPSVGQGKTVTLDASKVQVDGATEKYAISYPETVTADIMQETTTISPDPAKIDGLTYSGQPQALVTAGKTNVGFIVYSLDGINFSADIPTGTNAGTYNIYYKVDGTADYSGVAVNATPITVTIGPKPVTPTIELSGTSYLYDGTKKDPTITVKDGKTVIDAEQYTVTWTGTKDQTDAEMLTVADTYTATIKNVANGNYKFVDSENSSCDATATVEIVAAEQDAVNITGEPEHVYYGDTVTTLKTSGGSGTGTVTWSITEGKDSASIDPKTGKLTVNGIGSITVKAERSVPNYAPVSDTWTFTVEPKPVIADVTVEDKVYDGSNTATVTSAVVNDLVDSGDTITIDGLTGMFADVNVGTGKTVNLARNGFTINADADKYAVSIPATAHADITPRALTTVTVTLSDHDLKTDDVSGKYYYTFDGKEKTPAVAVEGSDEGGYKATLAVGDYEVSYAKNQNAGTADVTVKASAGGNYTFDDATVNFEIRNGAAVLTVTPTAKDLTYDGTDQDLVNVGTATGGTVVYSLTKEETEENPYSEAIPQKTAAGTYTVYYKVRGDGNHNDTVPGQVSVTIKPREITAIIALSGDDWLTESNGAYSCEYDGSAKKPTVTVTGGVSADPIAGTEYTVSYRDNTNAGTATVTVSDNNGGNYTVNGTAYFEITKKAPAVTAPVGKTGLQYNGQLQDLIEAGVSHDGTVMYSVNGGNWSAAVPTATARGDYEIKYKVQGDANHSDTDPATLGTVKIDKNTVNNPVISLSSEQFTFNGNQQKPAVTVYDDKGLVIPEHEYSVAITGGNMVDVGTYTVTVTTPGSSNYEITTDNDENGVAKNTRTFKIVPANQETISITGTTAQVRYGDTIQLGVSGGTGSGTLKWEVTGSDEMGTLSSEISSTGLLTVKDVGGPIKVTVTRSAGGNYSNVTATWEFSAAKKQVTAVVTADDRDYAENDTSATVHVSVPGSELVTGDTITINGVTGSFGDANVGKDKRVTVDSSGASASGTNADKYEISYPATTTASILAVAAEVSAEPGDVTPALTYDASQAQELVTAGTATGGIMVYSLDGTTFTPSIPKAKDAGTYTVWFKAQGDGNHSDSEPKSKDVTIGKQDVTPQIELSPAAAQYDGKEHKPAVTLRDGDNNVIPASEYKVTYVSDGGKNWTDKGDYTVKIENIAGGNYVISGGVDGDGNALDVTAPFTISTNAQNPLEITNKPGLVYYGDTFTLSAVGGSGNEKVTWSVDNASVVEIDANGFVKIKGTGSATITATKPGGDNYNDAKATYPLNALPKPITATVTADDKVYTGADPTTATLHFTWSGLVGNDTIDTTALTGTFDSPNAGQGKTVTITGTPVNDATSQKYVITIPGSTTASILKADAAAPELTANDREYDGSAQNLVSDGDDNTVYCGTRDGVYSANVPTATNAGTYTVWYKELGDDNHNNSEPQSKTVTISRKKLETVNITLSGNDLQVASKEDGSKSYSYVFDGSEKKPTVTIVDGTAVVPAGEYAVSYSNNKNVSTETDKGTVTITCNEGGNYTFDKQEVEFTITSAAAQLTKSPEARNLTYLGPDREQELLTVGTASGGHIEYSTDGGTTWSESIPKGEDARTYTVTYKVVGEGNYASNGDTWTVSVTIKPKEVVSPKVTVSGNYTYDGSAQIPAADNIKVEDGGTEIPVTEYTVSCTDNVDAGTATVVITNANGGNYIVNGTGTFSIGRAASSVGTAPTGKENLPYNGSAQELLATAGSANGGTMVYSLEQNGEYSQVIPTGTAVQNYTVYYKVQGDDNHNDFVPTPNTVTASIAVNAVENPTVQVEPEAVTFNGKKQEPTVTVKDDNGLVIDGSEYTVKYADSKGNAVTELKDAGSYTLTIASKTGGNYSFTTNATFEILPADQTPLTITGQRERVYYGDTIQLGTSGGSGTVTWAVSDGAPASIGGNGLLTVTGVGPVTVTATSKADGYSDKTASWTFYADKKPVTAVVTAASKDYDGKTDAAVTAALQGSDLVSGDTVKITLSGHFEDANAGAGKTVRVDSTDPKFDGSTGNYANYAITYPATTTASILKADIKAEDVTAPTAEDADNLEYTGLPLALVKAGSVTGGTMEYSTDNITYSASLPTGTDAGDYDVWYRVKGDSNHNDIVGTKLTETAKITIAQQKVENPVIELKPTGASFDGAVYKPEVTVKDKNGRVIPDSEYTVEYGDGNWKDKGTYAVTVKDVANGNYIITEKNATFEILATGQSPLTITGKPGTVRYGDSFTLSAVGGSGTGAIIWDVSPETGIVEINQNGLVKVIGSGSVTITAKKVADGNFGESTDSWTFSAEKKPVKAVVTAKNKEFDGKDEATLVITWKDGDLIGNDADEITLSLSGKFDSADVGNNKTVTISGTKPSSDKYEISWNSTTTASITPGTAKVTAPTPNELTYTGQAQELVIPGSATNGDILYSLDDIIYSRDIPKRTNAGTYTVWYKVEGSANYADVSPKALPVTIEPKKVDVPSDDITLSASEFDYDGNPKRPDVVSVKYDNTVIPASEYLVGYINNVSAGNATVIISDAPDGNYIVSGTKNFTIKAPSAKLLSAPQERELTYNGSAQALVTAGSAVNGKVMYSLTGNEDDYSTAIPKGTNAGVYDVYYKVVDNDGKDATTPESVPVTISPKQVTPTIMVGGKTKYSTPYTGEAQEPTLTVIADGKILTYLSDYYATYDDNTNPGTATVTVISLGNYQFVAFASFEITKSKAGFDLEPEANTGLVYTGEPQALVKSGTVKNGANVVYSLNGGTFYPFVPTATEIGDYVVSAKVEGNDIYADSETKSYRVTISKNTIAADKLSVTLSESSVKFTGSPITPGVTVRDGEGNIIAASEYSVSYSSNINVGQADVTVTSTTKNYSFQKTVHFEIKDADKTALTITGLPETVYYGDTLRLGTTGGSGTVTWSVENGSESVESKGNGQFKITGSGSITVKATAGDSSDICTFYADPRPVKAIVTAADKTYDGNTSVTSWTVIVTGLVSGDTIPSGSITVTGQFKDANAGADKTVYITGLSVPEGISAKYDISYDDSTTATIRPAPLSVTEENAPKKVDNLKYTGQPLALVTAGTAVGGNMMYSLDGVKYDYNIPKGTDAGNYTVWYKAVAADTNHAESAVGKVTDAAIGVNTGTPKVICTPDTFQFDGTPKAPTVVVWDDGNRTIPESEYNVTVTPQTAVGNYTVSVTDKPGGNYEFSTCTPGTFKIETGSQSNLTIDTELYDVYYGDSFRLSAAGGSGDGAIVWSIAGENAPATITPNGVVKVTGTGGFTVQAYRAAAGGYAQSNTVSLPFEAHAKPVTPIVTVADDGKPYDGNTTATLTARFRDGDLVGADSLALTVTGAFATADVGANKRVNIQTHEVVGIENEATKAIADKYDIRWPDSTTASIYKVDAKIYTAPGRIDGLTYAEEGGQAKAQALVTEGTTVGNIGTIVYSTSEKGEYSTAIPTGTNAGTYSVWYKVADSINYTGIPAAEIKAEIKKADPGVTSNPTANGGTPGQTLSEIGFSNGGSVGVSGTFAWKDGSITPPAGESDQDVVFTPDDTDNYNTYSSTIKVTVTAQTSESSETAQTQTTIRNGTASTVMSTSDGSRLVREAVANQSQNVVIKPNITGDVSKSEVSIPSSTVSRLSSDTDASLTVSSPVANVTIPNQALDTLGQAGGAVKVVTEQTEQAVALTVTAGGETVDKVPGGVTLSVPVEDPAPGTVAVLVNEDGTRETIRNSVVTDGMMNIPLNGSATVEIVDNSKDFDDVPADSWEADAVDFASSHELFGGTGETTFSPDMAMSRGMLATVLYRLEGNPELDLTGAFSDVSNGAWYADGVAWAAENGIVGGYGDGQFGPNDDVTREQFVVMLWRYAGSPEAGSQALDFADADQASSYATEALCWAVENGILNGVGGGKLDPKGTATRAQAAQLLKNFMENT